RVKPRLSSGGCTRMTHAIHRALPSDAGRCAAVVGRCLAFIPFPHRIQDLVMFSIASTTDVSPRIPAFAAAMPCPSRSPTDEHQRASQQIADSLKLLNDSLAPQRRIVHAGDVIYRSGERFDELYILNSGFFKI